MTKFYVQSGTFRRIVAADNSRKAALWAVHEVMQQILPTDSNDQCPAAGNRPAVAPNGGSPHGSDETPVVVLAAKVRVDERGFDRQDATELSTMEVVAEWNQMVMTLDRLQQLLDGTPTSSTPANQRGGRSRFTDESFSDDLAA